MDKEILEILKSIQGDISGMKGEISSIQGDISEMKVEMAGMKSTLDEHTQLLRALEHSAQVNKAEHDQMFNEIAHIRGDVEKIKDDLNIVEKVTAKNWSDIMTLKEAK